MSLNANESKNKKMSKIDPVPAGTYPARLVAVIDLGLQNQRDFKGQKKEPAYEILTTYELLDEFMKDEEGNELKDKPRWFSENFALYPLNSERARSTDRYLGVDPTAQHRGNWAALIGTPVMLTLVHNPSKTDKNIVYTNIDKVGPMRAKDAEKAPKLVNEPLVFDMDKPDLEVFKKIPKWVQDKITAALTYKGSKLESLLEGAPTSAPSGEQAPPLDDDIPF